MSFTLQEQLSTLPIPRLTTVLRVNFALLESQTSFEKATNLIAQWWNEKAVPYGVEISVQTSELEVSKAGFRANLARSDDEFVLAMQEPDSSDPDRFWLCDFAVRRAGPRSEFGVRLSYRQPHNSTNRPEPRAPRFLQDLIESVGAVDVRAMESRPRRIHIEDLPFFMDLVQSPMRTLPVIAISEESYSGKIFTDPDKLARILAGTAHVFCLDPVACWQLSSEWSNDWSTFQGAIRCYNPKFLRTDDKFKHRLWLPQGIQRFDANSRNGFLNACAAHVFTQVTAQFEPLALSTPAAVRRRKEASTVVEAASVSTGITPIIIDVSAPSLVQALGTRVNEAPEAVDVAPSELRTANQELLERLARLQEQAKTLEEALDQERAGRAESESRRDESEGYVRLYEEETKALAQERDLALGDISNEKSEALRPLWTSFSAFFNSMQNVAIQFRRMEADSDLNADLTRRLDQSNQTVGTLQAKLDSLELRPTKDSLQLTDSSEMRDQLTSLLLSLAQKNPQLSAALKAIAVMFPDRVTVLNSAYDSADESTAFRQGDKALDLLIRLVTGYWEGIQKTGDTEARKIFGTSYAPRESSTLSKPGIDRRTFIHDDKPILMEKHLKIGVADNSADTLRIHFEWLADDRRLVIGHCGRHLDF